MHSLTRQWQLLTHNSLHKFLIHRKVETYRIREKTCGSDLGSLWKRLIYCFGTSAVVCHVLHIGALYMNICSSQFWKNKLYKMLWQPNFLPFFLKQNKTKNNKQTKVLQRKKKPSPKAHIIIDGLNFHTNPKESKYWCTIFQNTCLRLLPQSRTGWVILSSCEHPWIWW